jgi:hypothetical protein
MGYPNKLAGLLGNTKWAIDLSYTFFLPPESILFVPLILYGKMPGKPFPFLS